MSKRKAISRHSRRKNPHGLAAADLIAPYRAPAVSDATAPLFLPGLHPALAR